MKEISWNYLDAPQNERHLDDSYYEYIRSPAWEKKRAQRMKVDGFACQICGAKNNLVVHHMTYENFGNELLSDLVTLCWTCHSRLHEEKDRRIQAEREQRQKQHEEYMVIHQQRTMQIESDFELFLSMYEKQDLAYGGGLNLCDLDTVRDLWITIKTNQWPQILRTQRYFGDIRRAEIWEFWRSGYSDSVIQKITGFSISMISKFRNYMYSVSAMKHAEGRPNYMKKIDLTNVPESGDSVKLPAGGYVCRYTNVEDKSDKEYLYMEYDIVEGEFANYYSALNERAGFWGGKVYRSYKPAALPMFKRMCSAVSKSNGNYVFDGQINNDERTLVGKLVGLVFGEEEYIGNDGNRKTRLYVASEKSVDDIRSGNYKVPKLKELKESGTSRNAAASANGFVDIPDGVDEELPFN